MSDTRPDPSSTSPRARARHRRRRSGGVGRGDPQPDRRPDRDGDLAQCRHGSARRPPDRARHLGVFRRAVIARRGAQREPRGAARHGGQGPRRVDRRAHDRGLARGERSRRGGARGPPGGGAARPGRGDRPLHRGSRAAQRARAILPGHQRRRRLPHRRPLGTRAVVEGSAALRPAPAHAAVPPAARSRARRRAAVRASLSGNRAVGAWRGRGRAPGRVVHRAHPDREGRGGGRAGDGCRIGPRTRHDLLDGATGSDRGGVRLRRRRPAADLEPSCGGTRRGRRPAGEPHRGRCVPGAGARSGRRHRTRTRAAAGTRGPAVHAGGRARDRRARQDDGRSSVTASSRSRIATTAAST